MHLWRAADAKELDFTPSRRSGLGPVAAERAAPKPLASFSSSSSSASSSASSAPSAASPAKAAVTKAEPKAKPKAEPKAKVADPKGPFELERMWKLCGDAAAKRKLAVKLLRPDGKVATKLFGAKSKGGLDAATLTDLLCARLLTGGGGGGGAKAVAAAADLAAAARALAAQPGLPGCAVFLAAPQQACLVSALAAARPALGDAHAALSAALGLGGPVAAGAGSAALDLD